MIKSGIETLRAIQMASVASDVVYKRLGISPSPQGEPRSGLNAGCDAKTVKAVVGRTVFRSTDESGIWTRIETRDFIVGKALIDFEPQVVPAACRWSRPIGKRPTRSESEGERRGISRALFQIRTSSQVDKGVDYGRRKKS